MIPPSPSSSSFRNPAAAVESQHPSGDGGAAGPVPASDRCFRPNPIGDVIAGEQPQTGFMDYTDDAMMDSLQVRDEAGIGTHPNAFESAAAYRERLEAGAQGVIAILIGQ